MELSQALQTLDIPLDVTAVTFDEAKEQYRLLIHVWHPDRHSHNQKLQDKATNKVQEINAAWDVLEKHFASGASVAVRGVSVPDSIVDNRREALRRFIFRQIYSNFGMFHY